MILFGIALAWPESLEIQAIGMKLTLVAGAAAALVYWSLIDARVAAMVVGGAAGSSLAWLLGFRQGRGRVVVPMQALAAGVCAVLADLCRQWMGW
ncbi:MAG: hypothetical protein EOM91_10435 [Sphingobacteriia bacterium]|jgi:uncharacterized protein (TIGR04206 family)|nr:hypothetical protein [Sphingobacteriia bacterium]